VINVFSWRTGRKGDDSHITWCMPDVGVGSTQNYQVFQTVEKYCVGVQTRLHQTACLTNNRSYWSVESAAAFVYIRTGSSPAAGPVVPSPPFKICVPPCHVWPPCCCIHSIQYFKNVAPFLFLSPPFGFWLPCCYILATGLDKNRTLCTHGGVGSTRDSVVGLRSLQTDFSFQQSYPRKFLLCLLQRHCRYFRDYFFFSWETLYSAVLSLTNMLPLCQITPMFWSRWLLFSVW